MWWNTPVVNHLDLLKLISVEQDKQFHRTSLIEALLYAYALEGFEMIYSLACPLQSSN